MTPELSWNTNDLDHCGTQKQVGVVECFCCASDELVSTVAAGISDNVMKALLHHCTILPAKLHPGYNPHICCVQRNHVPPNLNDACPACSLSAAVCCATVGRVCEVASCRVYARLSTGELTGSSHSATDSPLCVVACSSSMIATHPLLSTLPAKPTPLCP